MGPALMAAGVMRLVWWLAFKRFIASTSFALIGLPSIYGISKILSNVRAQQAGQPLDEGPGRSRRLISTRCHFDATGAPVIWASRAATAERKLSGITFA